jgi:hypothetical protein
MSAPHASPVFDAGAALIARCRELLRHTYLPKVRLACAPLGDADVWWRPVEGSNSIGVLLVHMAGNARQYIASGIGGAPMTRDRDAEFATDRGMTRDGVVDHFAAAIRDCDAVLATLPPAALGERRTIQGRELTVLDAIVQVTEHVAGHVGQVIQLAKWRAPGMIRFYEASTHGVRVLWSPDDDA